MTNMTSEDLRTDQIEWLNRRMSAMCRHVTAIRQRLERLDMPRDNALLDAMYCANSALFEVCGVSGVLLRKRKESSPLAGDRIVLGQQAHSKRE
jgi:hypothetical protein